MKQILKFATIFTFLFLLASCGGDKKRNLADSASAFINGNDKVIVFGSIDLLGIFNKAEYKDIPMVGDLIKGQIKRVQSGLNLDAGFYYAMEGPFEGGNPGTTYLFAEVKNLDSLKTVLTQDGYDFENKDGLDYFRDGDATVGIKNNIAIMFVKNGEYDEVAIANKAFELASGDLMEGSGAKLLAQKGDISINSHMYNQFVTANKRTMNLPKEKMDQLSDMMKESFAQANIHFEKGQLRIAFDNEFSANLSKRMMFKEDASGALRKKVGGADPIMAFATNLDMTKLEAWLEDFAPDLLDQMAEKSAPLQMAMTLSAGKIGNIITGTTAFGLFDEPLRNQKIENYNFYLGLGPNGAPLANMAQNLGGISNFNLIVEDNALYGASGENKATKSTTLNVPKGCETFGKTAISGFVNVDKMNLEVMELKGGEKLLELVKYMNLTFNNEGGEILVKAKNPNQNILKQVVDKMLKEFEGEMGNLAM